MNLFEEAIDWKRIDEMSEEEMETLMEALKNV